jgi:hypothetical protein
VDHDVFHAVERPSAPPPPPPPLPRPFRRDERPPVSCPPPVPKDQVVPQDHDPRRSWRLRLTKAPVCSVEEVSVVKREIKGETRKTHLVLLATSKTEVGVLVRESGGSDGGSGRRDEEC